MESFAYGGTIRLRGTFRDPDTRDLEDPVGAVTVVVTRPDGSTASTSGITHPSTGIYETTVLPTVDQQGRWHYRWQAAVSGVDPASAESSYFLIRD